MGRMVTCYFAAAIALIGFWGIGYGIGLSGAAAVEGIARQPEASGTITDFHFYYVVLPEFILASILAGLSWWILSRCRHNND